ncbi:iron ABC transporter permease [Paenibacillus sp. YSY-4.3]
MRWSIFAQRWPLVLILLILLNLAVLLLHLMLGERLIPPVEAIRTALSLGSGEYDFAIRTVRLPRACVGLLAGCGLALSGTILQGITRNPLASPGVLGLNAGAAAAAVAVIVLLPSLPMRMMPFAAFGGALLAAALIYIFSWRKGKAGVSDRILLVGIGISAMAGGIVSYLLTLGEVLRVTQATIWMAGSLYGRTWVHVWPLLPWVAVLLPVLVLMSRSLDLFQLGENTAIGLGLRLEKMRFLFILIAVALAGAAVSMAGTVTFVGLMGPHIARGLVGSRSCRLIPTAALCGALLVLLSDLAGRLVFQPYEIPVGIVTALIGAPYMLRMLWQRAGAFK